MRMLQLAQALVLLSGVIAASQLAAEPLPASPPDRAARDMASQANAMNSRVNAHVNRGRRLREHTDAKDMIRLSCINDGMITLLLQARISEAAFAAFKVAASGNDPQAMHARLLALTRAVDAADASSEDIRGCIGVRDIEVHHSPFGSDPTDDCNALGQSGCMSQSLEYVALASPYTPR